MKEKEEQTGRTPLKRKKTFIELLKESGNKFLEKQSEYAEMWSKLKHTKADLELFLKHNIAELRFKPKGSSSETKTIVCSSNVRLIALFHAVKKSDREEILKKVPFGGIKTKEKNKVLTFNLVDDTYNTVSLKSWELGNFVTLTEDNVELLDLVVKDVLKRKRSSEDGKNLLFFK